MGLLTALCLLAVATAVGCALPGVFLVLRHQSMLVDAMSHAVFPGIVIGAALSGSTHSPLMVVVAVAMGLLVVVIAERFAHWGVVTRDAGTALVFPVLFAIGIALLSTRLNSVHLSEASALTGELNLMALPTERVVIGTIDLGPRMMWWMIGMSVVSGLFLALTHRILGVSSFDPNYAAAIGMPAAVVGAVLMVLVSVTCVVAFSTVGAILVVALMIVPPATARLVTNRISTMIWATVVVAASTALVGLFAAYITDLPTAPMMAVVDALVFCVVLGVVSVWPRRTQGSASK